MRKLALAIGIGLGVLASSAASAIQTDALWADSTTGGSNVPISPYTSGDKVSLGSDTLGSGLGTWDLVITGYSRTWDVTTVAPGAQKQLDVFLSYSDEGLSGYNMSVRFDAGSLNMLNVVTIREYNVSVGSNAPSIDWGLGNVNPCEPYNNCGNGRNTGSSLDGLGNVYLAQESTGGATGWIYRFGGLQVGTGPATKNSTQVGTIRVGSILFELNSNTGSSVVTFGEIRFPGALDSANRNDGSRARWTPRTGTTVRSTRLGSPRTRLSWFPNPPALPSSGLRWSVLGSPADDRARSYKLVKL